VEDLGKVLKEQRLARGITLEQMQQRTRIRLSYLQAIEENQWNRLPGPVYVKAFLRHYARLVGLDEKRIINSYDKIIQPNQEPESRKKAKRKVSVNGLVLLLSALCLAGSLYLGANMFMKMNPPTRANAPVSNGRESLASSSESGGGSSAGNTVQVTSNGNQTTKSGSNGETGLITTDSSNWESGTVPNSMSLDTPQQNNSLDSNQNMVNSTVLNLIIFVDDECWVEASIDDSRVLYRTMQQGEIANLLAKQKIQIKLGRAENVRLVFNGDDLGVAGKGIKSIVFTSEDVLP
jgi:cytoskeleton protein RodZ